MKLVITFTVVALILFVFLAYSICRFTPKFINLFERWTNNFAVNLMKYRILHSEITRHVIYIIFFIMTAGLMYLFYLVYQENMLALFGIFIYPLIVILLGSILNEHRKKSPQDRVSIQRKKRENYILNRLKILFGDSLFDLSIYLLVIYLFATIIITFGAEQIPFHVIYVFLFMLPTSLVLFIYIGYKSQSERNLRRILSYIFLLVLAVADSYYKLQVLLGIHQMDEAFNYLIYIIVAIFSALDNCVQAISNDYQYFKDGQAKKER